MDDRFVALIGAPAEFLQNRSLEEAVHIIEVRSGNPPVEAPWSAEARPLAQPHRWIALEGELLPDGSGIEVTGRDITAARRGEIFRSASLKLARLVADGIRTDAEERLAGALREVLHFDRVRLIRLQMSTSTAALVLASGSATSGSVGFGPPGLSFPGSGSDVELAWDRTVMGSVGDSAGVVVIRDLTALEDPPDEVSALVAEGYRALAGVPLRIARRTVGALLLDRRETGDFGEQEVSTLEDLAPLFSAALDRIRLERAAVDSASVYATVFETAGEGILLSDVESGQIDAVNTRYLELTGYRRRKLLEGMRIQDVDPSTPTDPMARAHMIRENPGPVMAHHLKRSGRRLPVEVTRRMFTWRGRATELTVVRDVRERLKAESQIRRLAAAVDAVSLGVLLTNADGTVGFVNPALERLIGVAPGSVVGRDVEELRCLDSKSDFEGEVEIDAPARGRFPAYISRAQFQSTSGPVAGAVEIWTDLTEQKERDQQLMQADKLSSLGQTAASVAHEINNPLAFIIANLRTLIEYTTDIRNAFDALTTSIAQPGSGEHIRARVEAVLEDDALTDALEDIDQLTSESLRGAERVRTIVADLRAYARRKDIMQPCDLRKIADNALTLAKNELRYRAEVVADFPETLPKVIGSPGRLEQVLLNLILNAVQALPTEARPNRPNRIWVRLRAEGDQAVVEVEDNGMGMTDEVREKIFNQFFTTKDTKRGTGLGLFISKKIIDNHGGTFTVLSEVNEGSVFRIGLPTEPELPASATKDNGRRCKVLLIDGERLVLDSLLRVLSPHHDVTAVESGQVGLRKAETGGFDVIVCELGLPDLPGDLLFNELKKSHPDVGRRFVIISGGAVSPHTSGITTAEGVHRLVKPVEPEKLLTLIAQISDPPAESKD